MTLDGDMLSPDSDWLGLSGRTGVILGATGGLGRVIAHELENVGMRLFAVGGTNQSRLESLLAAPRIERGMLVDVRSDQDVTGLANDVTRWCEGKLDCLIYAAGVNPSAAETGSLSVDDWDSTFAVNLRGAYLVIKALLPALRAGTGKIVLISSIFGLNSPAGRAAYGASKHGLTGLMQSVTHEQRSNIQINALAPGPAWGENVRHIFAEHAHHAGMSIEEYTRQRTQRIPLGRFMEPHELANSVAFLCSDRSSYINGQVIAITGGANE